MISQIAANVFSLILPFFIHSVLLLLEALEAVFLLQTTGIFTRPLDYSSITQIVPMDLKKDPINHCVKICTSTVCFLIHVRMIFSCVISILLVP